jgi:predicted ATPase/class 3 adenylate cyclase
VEVNEAATDPRQAREPPSGTVAFLFTDIAGSTLIARARPADYERLLDRHRAILRDVFARNAGFEVGTEGDSFFVVFGSVLDALRAAAEGQRSLSATDWPEGAELRVRMGLHLGEATRRGTDYVGPEIHRAARVVAAGHGGQVLLSEAMAAVVGDRVPEELGLRDLGQFRLKDFGAPARIFQLVGPGLTADFPPLKAPSVRSTNLADRRSSFIGRRRERAAAARALRTSRLVTLTGPGGSGKTSLAVEVARERIGDYPDGVWLVELAALREPEFAVTNIGEVLGIPGDPGVPPRQTLMAHLATRKLLLVLDNLEHLLPEIASLVDLLMDASPRLQVLATSREPLHLAGEQELPVPPLQVPDAAAPPAPLRDDDAVRLFVDRARGVDPTFTLTDANRLAVGGIVRRLDGLPLGIELAAARVKLLSAAEILERLEHGSRELGKGVAGRPERQRSLQEAIAWSYRLLPSADQRLFARFSVFAGGCSIESADDVCNPDGELGLAAMDVLASLVDKSLVIRVQSPIGSRFGMLETIREFASEELRVQDPDGQTAARQAGHMLALVERAAPELTKANSDWLTRLSLELENLRAALTWAIEVGDAETGMRLCGALWRFWQVRALLSEGREWCGRVLAMEAGATPTSARAVALMAAGNVAYWQREPVVAERLYRESLAAAEIIGDDRQQAEALLNLMYVAAQLQDPPNAIELEDRVKELAARLNEPMFGARAEFAAVGLLAAHGHFADAFQRVQQAVLEFESTGDLFWSATAASIAAGMALQTDDLDQAGVWARRAAHGFHALGDDINLATVFRGLAAVAARSGDFERGARLAGFGARLISDAGGDRSPMPAEIEDALEIAVRELGREHADAAWQEGHAMSREDAIALALQPDPVVSS